MRCATRSAPRPAGTGKQGLRLTKQGVGQHVDGYVVERTKILLCKNLGYRAVKYQVATLKAHEPRGVQRSQITVVYCHKHTGSGGTPPLKQIKQFNHARPVKASSQFIQQQ